MHDLLLINIVIDLIIRRNVVTGQLIYSNLILFSYHTMLTVMGISSDYIQPIHAIQAAEIDGNGEMDQAINTEIGRMENQTINPIVALAY